MESKFVPLSRRERIAASAAALQANFSYNGYAVVHKEFFSHKFDPTLTIKDNSITFNAACIRKLEQVVYVQLLINIDTQTLLIRPCREGSRDAIRWCITKDDTRKSRQITCRDFTERLYNLMKWEKVYRYKLQGSIIDHNGEQLYAFFLDQNEPFVMQPNDPANPGSRRQLKRVTKEEWDNSFGIDFMEHEASCQIDISKGYVEVGEEE